MQLLHLIFSCNVAEVELNSISAVLRATISEEVKHGAISTISAILPEMFHRVSGPSD